MNASTSATFRTSRRPPLRIGSPRACNFILGPQGSYPQYNVGDATVPPARRGPEYEGTRATEADEIGSFHVVSKVSATTAVPSGMPAVPLARVDVPANTTVIEGRYWLARWSPWPRSCGVDVGRGDGKATGAPSQWAWMVAGEANGGEEDR
ncbi:hypothetical protein [Streptomyces sp. YKOK-I1]